jgi:hypothetical protein
MKMMMMMMMMIVQNTKICYIKQIYYYLFCVAFNRSAVCELSHELQTFKKIVWKYFNSKRYGIICKWKFLITETFIELYGNLNDTLFFSAFKFRIYHVGFYLG